MTAYWKTVILLNFLVDWLLLMGANRLCGYPVNLFRTALGGVLGGFYAGMCMLPGFAFLAGMLWHTAFLLLMALIAYGLCTSAVRRAMVFLLLSMAISGISVGLGGGLLTLACAAAAVCLLCFLGFVGKIGTANYVPVELDHAGRHVKLTALQDTGNSLRDPVTGAPVLVVDCDAAQSLTGLTSGQLRQPVETIGTLPGLRLIPYRAVGTENGLLLGMQIGQVKIGKWQGKYVVAFAPGKLSANGEYQALTGGTV